MAAAIAQAKSDYQNGWEGEITAQLKTALKQVEGYLELRSSPTRAERTFAGLAKLDPMIEALPDHSQQRKLRRYRDVARKFEKFTHHQSETNEQEIRDCIAQAEDLILDLMAPITADDQNLLSAIIAEGEHVHREQIKKALHLIDRRGANLAFFFQNVAHPVWLKPLQEAGYFNDPPTIIRQDDGFLIPFWWPMIFLKRVAGQAAKEVVDILLKIGDTNNPRILDGITEIASKLSVDLAVRLEPVIRKYINQPYHV
jgi:hypothetical protein